MRQAVPGEGTVVLLRSAGDAALFSAGRRRCADYQPVGDRDIDIEAEGFNLKNRQHRFRLSMTVAGALIVFLWFFDIYVALAPAVLIAGLMLLAALSSPHTPGRSGAISRTGRFSGGS